MKRLGESKIGERERERKTNGMILLKKIGSPRVTPYLLTSCSSALERLEYVKGEYAVCFSRVLHQREGGGGGGVKASVEV